MKKQTSTILFLIGTIVAAIAAAPAPSPSTITIPFTAPFYWVDARTGVYLYAPLNGEMVLGLDFDLPSAPVPRGKPFQLTAKVTVKSFSSDARSIVFVTNYSTGEKELRDITQASAREGQAETYLSTLPFTFRLQLPGAKVDPAGPVSCKNGVVTWSITPTEARRVKLTGSVMAVTASSSDNKDCVLDKPKSDVPVTITLAPAATH